MDEVALIFDPNAPTDHVGAHFLAGDVEAEWELLRRAGAGDRKAGRIVMHHCATLVANKACTDCERVLGMAEGFARLNAASGDWVDRQSLAGVLSLRIELLRDNGRLAEMEDVQAECLTILSELADEGCEEAGTALATFAYRFSPAAMARASSHVADHDLALPDDESEVREKIEAEFDAAQAVEDDAEVSLDTLDRAKRIQFLARTIAQHHGLPFDLVESRLLSLGADSQHLLDTPAGWTVLATEAALAVNGTSVGAWRPSVQ